MRLKEGLVMMNYKSLEEKIMLLGHNDYLDACDKIGKTIEKTDCKANIKTLAVY